MYNQEVIHILNLPIGSLGIIVDGKHKGMIGYRTASCFFIVDDPTIDWLATASIYVTLVPIDSAYIPIKTFCSKSS